MPEKFKQALNLSIGIPMWSLVSFLAGLVFYAGATLNKLNTLLDNYGKTEQLVAKIHERQIERGSILQNHETRITALERNSAVRGQP